jgi:hypothetical protein
MRKLLALLFALWAGAACAQTSLGSTVLQVRPAGSGGPTVDDIKNYTNEFPGYIVGNWYMPTIGVGGGAAPGAGSIRLYPGYIKQLVTINSLGFRISTGSAGGNVQAAIYANNPATGRPIGNPLASTASMSTTSTGSVNATVSIQLQPGLYWWASNCDNGTAVFVSASGAFSPLSFMIGNSAQAVDLTAVAGFVGTSVTQTFGTWPDLTSASFSDFTSNSAPIVQFKVGSVP